MDLGLTVDNVKGLLGAFQWSNAGSAIDTMIEEQIAVETSLIEVIIAGRGFDVDEISETTHARLYVMARQVVSLRVAATLLETLSQDRSSLSASRRTQANNIERLIIDSPESSSADWKQSEQTGTWGYGDGAGPDETVVAGRSCGRGGNSFWQRLRGM